MTDTSSHLATAAAGAPAATSAPETGASNAPHAGGGRFRLASGRSKAAVAAPRVAALRILVVEDDALIQMLMCETLVSMGHEVCASAATQTEAVEATRQSHPDLVIVDSHLDLGDGLATVRQILRARSIPHILVSEDGSGTDLFDPASVTLQKPYQEIDLARAITRAMARSAG